MSKNTIYEFVMNVIEFIKERWLLGLMVVAIISIGLVPVIIDHDITALIILTLLVGPILFIKPNGRDCE